MINLIGMVIGTIFLIWATLNDENYGQIPNKVSYSAIAIGFIIAIISLDLARLILAIFMLILSFSLWRFLGLGGGDAKMVVALTLLFPLSISMFAFCLSYACSYIFMLLFGKQSTKFAKWLSLGFFISLLQVF